MTGAERVRLHRQRKAIAELRYTSDEWRAFVDPAGLQRKAGASWQDMPALILKELADNAADAANGAGARIEPVTINGADWWLIEDHGDGIKPDQVARIFAVNRPMESTKHVRRVSRGMLGNGTRVVAGYAAIKGYPIMVESLGVRTVLRIDKVTGRTVIERQQSVEADLGTKIYLPREGDLAGEHVASLARRSIALADPMPDARHYAGPSNPWWYGAADLLRLLATAPAGASIGDVVRDMGLALPRGVPDGLAADATEERAAQLLTALRERHRPIGAHKIGHVGRDAFGNEYAGYAIEHFIRTTPSGAEVPIVVEVWAQCDGWKRGDKTVTMAGGVQTYLNRSAVMSGVRASGARETVSLQGAGIGWKSVEAKSGRYGLNISIITPHAELLSDGKAPDFGHLGDALTELIGEAMRRARRGVLPDDASPEEIGEAERGRQEREAEARSREQRRQQREVDQVVWPAPAASGARRP